MYDQKRSILISTFYTPGLLWFIYADDIQKRERFSEKINNVAKLRLLKDFEIGQRVIVQYDSTWVRAELVKINVYDTPTKECVCWLYDYGLFCIIFNGIYDMPEDVELYPSFIKKGMMYGMIPCLKESNVETGKMIKIREHWFAPGIRRNISALLSERGCPQMFILRCEHNGYEIGDLFALDANGEETNLATYIMDSGLADYNEPVFQTDLFKRKKCELPLFNVYKSMTISEIRYNPKNTRGQGGDTIFKKKDSISNTIGKQPSCLALLPDNYEESNNIVQDDWQAREQPCLALLPDNNNKCDDSKADNNIIKNSLNNTQHVIESTKHDNIHVGKEKKSSCDRPISIRSKQIRYLQELFNKRIGLSPAKAGQKEDIVDEMQFADVQNDSQISSNTGILSGPANIGIVRRHISCMQGRRLGDSLPTLDPIDPLLSNAEYHSLIQDTDKRGNSDRSSNIKTCQVPSSKGRGISSDCKELGKPRDANNRYIGRGYANMPLDLDPPIRPRVPVCDMALSTVREVFKQNAAKAYKVVPFPCFPAGANLSNMKYTTKTEVRVNNPNLRWSQYDERPPENKIEHNQVAASSSESFSCEQILNKKKVDKIMYESHPQQEKIYYSQHEKHTPLNATASEYPAVNPREECCNEKKKSVSQEILQFPECDFSQCDKSENSESHDTAPKLKIQIISGNLLIDEKNLEKMKSPYKLHMNTEKMHKLPMPRLLVHGLHVPIPITNLDKLSFDSHVQKCLTELKYDQPNLLQTYAWPAILRGQNVILIDNPKSGKTLSYAPAICSFTSSYSAKLCRKMSPVCPLVIIFCPGIEVVENVYNIIIKILSKRKRIVMLVPPFGIEQQIELDKGVDILVCTPRMFVRITKEKLIRLLRVDHIIIENANEVFQLFAYEMKEILRLFHNIRRQSYSEMQLIAVAEEYTTNIEILACQLKRSPILCFGSYLEAAYYGWVKTLLKFTGPVIKQFQVVELIRDQSTRFKTLIICNDLKDSTLLIEYLNTHGFTFIYLNEKSEINDIKSAKCTWSNVPMGRYPVLVCTDKILNETLTIDNADIVIQYNLPNSWDQFVYRYSSFTDNYQSPIFTEKGEQYHDLRMYVFLDEDNLTLFPLIMQHFLKKNTTFNANLVNRFTEAIYEIDRQKMDKNVKICPNVMFFGVCNSRVTCFDRHILSPGVDQSKRLPKNSYVKLELLYVHNAGLLSAQIIEYVDYLGKVHQVEDHYPDIEAELKKIVSNTNRTKAFDVRIGSIAAVEASHNDMQRCKVLEVHKGTLNQPQMVVVKLLDIGYEMDVPTNNLFMIPDKLKIIPPQAIEVYLAGTAPPDLDKLWSKHCGIQFRTELKKSPHNFYTGKVVLQLGNAIYVDNLIQKNESDDELTCSIKSIKEFVLSKKLAEENRVNMTRLYQLCDASGIKVLHHVEKNTLVQQTPNFELETLEEYNSVG